jgi:acyl-CoA thioester hydrolase
VPDPACECPPPDPWMAMIDLAMAELRGRVLLSNERVKFAAADPYGHLASGAYVDMIMSHRVEVLEDLVGFSILRYAKSGIAFPARNVSVSYLRPALVGERLEVASWIQELGTSSFEVRVVIAGVEDRNVRALARIHFVTVDARSGTSVPVPETLPSSADSNPLPSLQTASAYVSKLIGLPEEWRDAAVSLGPGGTSGRA